MVDFCVWVPHILILLLLSIGVSLSKGFCKTQRGGQKNWWQRDVWCSLIFLFAFNGGIIWRFFPFPPSAIDKLVPSYSLKIERGGEEDAWRNRMKCTPPYLFHFIISENKTMESSMISFLSMTFHPFPLIQTYSNAFHSTSSYFKQIKQWNLIWHSYLRPY